MDRWLWILCIVTAAYAGFHLDAITGWWLR